MENEFKYVLELTGSDYTGVLTRNPEHNFPVPFREWNFYRGIQEAVEELILRDVRRFDPVYHKIKTGNYYDSGKIVSLDNSETVLQISQLPYQGNEVYEHGSVLEGIYMDFGKKTVKDFENLTDFDFCFQNNYDPDSRYLELALAVNDSRYGIGLHLEFMTEGWFYNLEADRKHKELYDNRWKYVVETIASPLVSSAVQETRRYHFYDLSEAFRFLLKNSDLNRMDKDLEMKRAAKNWVSSARLNYRHHGKISEIVTAKKFGEKGITSQPGIHLKSYIAFKELEKEAKIDLSEVTGYGRRDNCLLLAGYFRNSTLINPVEEDYSRIIPVPAYLELLEDLRKSVTEEKNKKQHPAGNKIEQKKKSGKRSIQLSGRVGRKL